MDSYQPPGLNRISAARSVSARIVLFALAATLLPALGLGGVSYFVNRDLLGAKISQELRSSASFAARETDLWLKQREHDARLLAAANVIQTDLERYLRAYSLPEIQRVGVTAQASQRLGDFLRLVAPKLPGFRRLGVLDPAGLLVAVSDPETTLSGLPENWLTTTSYGDAVLGSPLRVAEPRAAGVPIAVPVRSGENAVLGVLLAEIRLDALGAILRGSVPKQRGRLYVLGQDGTVILEVRAEGAALPASALAADRVRAELVSATGNALLYTDGAGDRRVAAVERVTRSGWGLVTEVDHDLAFQDVIWLRNVTLALLLAVILAVGALAYRMARAILRPLRALTHAARRVARGDLDVELPREGADELAFTARVFNQMVSRLRNSRDEVAAMNQALQDKNRELETASVTDALTGLHNRRFLVETLERQIALLERGHPGFTALLLDVDHIKHVNDNHGHLAGDAVLRRIAELLRESVRSVDYAGRYGGEEFLVLLIDTPPEEAEKTAERIRERIAGDSFRGCAGTELRVTVSIGGAGTLGDADHAERLLATADKALYAAKAAGRNRVMMARRTAEDAAGRSGIHVIK